MIHINSECIASIERIANENQHILLINNDDLEFVKVLNECIKNYQSSQFERCCVIIPILNTNIMNGISDRDSKEFLRIYGLYDFSDKVSVISDAEQYGNLYNYVKNGILTREEMIEALLI